MPIKFLVLGGGRGSFGRGGGGSANFIFMGVGIFPKILLLRFSPVRVIHFRRGVSGIK